MEQLTGRLSETALRSALVRFLAEQPHSEGVLIEELAIEHGAARIDVAIAGEDLAGYEIKSDFDTLDRLARQMHAYQRVFDRLTVVTTSVYADQVTALLPSWWGVLVGESDNGEVRLSYRRHAAAHTRQDPRTIAAMLWRDEALAFALNQLQHPIKSRATRDELYELIATQVPMPAIKQRVIAKLKSREISRQSTYTLPEASWRTV